jgi:N utilization substance protein B
MKQRHKARETALQILYRYEAELGVGNAIPEGPALAQDIARHFEHFQSPETTREFAAELVAGTLREMKSIDELIEKHATNWKIARMALIDRSLLRMSIYELSHCRDIPPSVTIDEAVELAKEFGSEDSPTFVNGVLDSIAKELRPGETKQPA